MWIPKRSSEGTLKAKCKEFYDSYEGEKGAFAGFYQKVVHNPGTPREELIFNRKPEPYKYKAYVYSGKYPELYEWYSKQPNPEVKFAIFVARVRDGGYPKEIAITNGEAWLKAKAEKAAKGPKKAKGYIPTYSKTPLKETIVNDDYFYIKIKYPTQVARVFIKEYENLIEELERKAKDIFDKESRNKIEADITRIRGELMVFKCYNGM